MLKNIAFYEITLQVNNSKNSYDKKYKTFMALCLYEPEYIENPQAVFISLYFP